MTFVLRMVARETRASWRRLIFFFLCVAIGVGAMAAVRSVIQNVRGALARALANEPPILMADEPTGNLDSVNGRHVMDLLWEVNRARGTTLVLVTHDRELAAGADQQIMLRDGRIVQHTAPERAAV